MSEPDNIEMVIGVLKTVPEKKLLLIEIANSIPINNGILDLDVLHARQADINLAMIEAKNYGGYTIMAVDSLVRLRPRPEV